FAVFAGHGGTKQEPAAARKQLADPAAPDHGVAAAEQKAVARIAAVEHAEGEAVAAVVDVVEQGLVAACEVLRGEDDNVGLELNLAGAVARGQMKVDHG